MSLLLWAAGLSAESDTPSAITEERAVELALERNLNLQSSDIDRESAEGAYGNRWNIILPDFSLSGGLSRSEPLLEEPAVDSTWSVNGGLSARLDLNSSAAFAMTATELAYQAENLSYNDARQLLVVNVKKQFNYLLVYKENLALQERNLELAEKRFLQAETNFRNGLASELTVMEAHNSFEGLKPSLQETRTIYETRLMSFKKLLGLDLAQAVDVAGPLTGVTPRLNCEALLEAYLMNRRDVRSAVNVLESAENQLAIVKAGNLSPSLSLSSGWTSSAPDVSDPDWIDSLTLSATLSLPLNGLIPGSSESLDLKDSSRAVEKARLNLKETISTAEQDIRTILMELDGYRETIDISGLSVDLAQKTFDMTEAAYLLGSREVLDVEAAQNNLLEAEQNLLMSRYNFLSGLLDLEYALNADLDEILTVGE